MCLKDDDELGGVNASTTPAASSKDEAMIE